MFAIRSLNKDKSKSNIFVAKSHTRICESWRRLSDFPMLRGVYDTFAMSIKMGTGGAPSKRLFVKWRQSSLRARTDKRWHDSKRLNRAFELL